MTEGSDIVLVIGAFAGMLGGFYAIAKIMLKQAAKDREADRTERVHLHDAIDRMASSTQRVAEATERSANEAKIRNGHLGEQHTEIVRSVEHVAKAIEIGEEE